MKISIAMTTYNGEKYIEKQLLSLLNQSKKPDEVIIKDDASTDDTANIILAFIKKHLLTNWKFSVNEKNIGYRLNFYNAISETNGDIIFLCDQDDIWHENKIEIITGIFEKDDRIKVINTSFNLIDGDDGAIPIKLKKNKANWNLIDKDLREEELIQIKLDTILYKNISPGCTLAFTKEIKEYYIKVSKQLIPHDWELNILAAINDSLYFYNKALINYRLHANNTIGLNDNISDFKKVKQVSYQARIQNNKIMEANKFVNYVLYFKDGKYSKNIKIIDTYIKFRAARTEALEKRSLLKVLKLYRYYYFYIKSVNFKGCLGDIYCVINKNIV